MTKVKEITVILYQLKLKEPWVRNDILSHFLGKESWPRELLAKTKNSMRSGILTRMLLGSESLYDLKTYMLKSKNHGDGMRRWDLWEETRSWEWDLHEWCCNKRDSWELTLHVHHVKRVTCEPKAGPTEAPNLMVFNLGLYQFLELREISFQLSFTNLICSRSLKKMAYSCLCEKEGCGLCLSSDSEFSNKNKCFCLQIKLLINKSIHEGRGEGTQKKEKWKSAF